MRFITGGEIPQPPLVLRRQKLSDCELAPIAPTAADDDDEQAERQVDSDDLADAVEGGAGARPVLDIDCAFERQPWSVEQPDEQRDHEPADHLHQVDVEAAPAKPPNVVNSIQ